VWLYWRTTAGRFIVLLFSGNRIVFLCKTNHLFVTVFAQADGCRMGRGFSSVYVLVCLFVCLFSHTISQKPMQLGPPNLTQKCFTMSSGKPFILGSKDHILRSRDTKTLPAWVMALVWVLTSFSLYLLCSLLSVV